VASEQRRCAQCGSPLDGDQQYCLTCGARAGERSPRLNALLGNVATAPPAAASAEPAPAAAAASAPSEPLRLPGPTISAVLVAVFVGFGALIGNADAGDRALPARQVRLVQPSTSASTEAPSSSSSSSEGGNESAEAPEAEPEETPAPAARSTTTPNSPASSGGGGSGGSTSSGNGSSKPTAAAPKRKLTSIKHVFVIVLSDQPYAANFGPETAGYLAHGLEQKGELLLSYDAIAHEQLPNGIALLSGQGPTAQTAANCPAFTPLAPASAGPDGQALGAGCVYPASVQTLPGQLEAKHLLWRAYVEGIGEAPGQPAPCSHPAPGSADATAAGGPYATYRNPFVYFEAITAAPACQTSDVGLSQLKTDLAGPAATAPQLSYIVPDRCHDGGPTPCSSGAPDGPAAAASWLEVVVPGILASKAYKQGGLLVITGDEAPSSGEFEDSSSCCGQPAYPNYTSPEIDHGGGDVGALLLSPFVKGGTTSQDPYNHFSLLRTIEDVFGLGHLGYAALPAVKSFSTALLNAPAAKKKR
jgi:hypothetical protein